MTVRISGISTYCFLVLSGLDFKILHRYFLCEPDSVYRKKKLISILFHLPGVDTEQYRLSVPAPDICRGIAVRGKMYIEAVHPQDSLLCDRWDKTFTGSVPEYFRRGDNGKLHIHRNGVALVCTNEYLIVAEGILESMYLNRKDSVL